MPLLSIIIPVFNKAAFIDDAILSVRNQSVSDFELILIDDGSTDSSLEKCKSHLAQDSRIVVIIQPNKGVSAARNAGLLHATGKYIGFLDADDTIEKDMYEILLHNAREHQADISICAIRRLYNNVGPKTEMNEPLKIFTRDEALTECFRGTLDWSANNKIYKSEIARSIYFEGLVHEDLLYTVHAFEKCNKVVFQNLMKYNYIIRSGSASMKKFSSSYMESVKVTGRLVNIVAMRFRDHLAEVQALDLIANISILNLILLTSRSSYTGEYRTVSSTIHSYAELVKNKALLRKKHRYATRLFMLSPLLYSMAVKLYCRFFETEASKRI